MSATDVSRVLIAGFSSCVAALACLDVFAWRRTAQLRGGRAPPDRLGESVPAVARTSWVTMLPAVAGTTALAWSVVTRSPLPLRAGMAGGGLIVAVSGTAARVKSVAVTRSGVLVRFGLRGPHLIPWSGIESLSPPRWPFGGWRMGGPDVSRTLMPSDLLGHEWVLSSIVERAGLEFVGRRWMRTNRVGVSPGA